MREFFTQFAPLVLMAVGWFKFGTEVWDGGERSYIAVWAVVTAIGFAAVCCTQI